MFPAAMSCVLIIQQDSLAPASPEFRWGVAARADRDLLLARLWTSF
jgi:hypothetical protein